MNLTLPQTNHTYALYAITVDDYVERTDEKQIRKLFDTMKQAWEDADAAAFGACFTEDSDFVSFRGEHYKGKASNITAHEKSFNSTLKNTRLYINIKSIRFLNETMAVVHAEGTVLKEFETPTNCNLKYATNMLIKEQGTWKITSFHNSQKKKPGFFSRLFGM